MLLGAMGRNHVGLDANEIRTEPRQNLPYLRGRGRPFGSGEECLEVRVHFLEINSKRSDGRAVSLEPSDRGVPHLPEGFLGADLGRANLGQPRPESINVAEGTGDRRGRARPCGHYLRLALRACGLRFLRGFASPVPSPRGMAMATRFSPTALMRKDPAFEPRSRYPLRRA